MSKNIGFRGWADSTSAARRLVLGAGLALALLLSFVAGYAILKGPSVAAAPFTSGSYSSLAGLTNGHPHKTFDFAFSIENDSSKAVVMRRSAFPKGLPAHLRLTHEVISTGSLGFFIAPGWIPPGARRTHGSFVTSPISGYLLRPRRTVQVVFGFVGSRRGIYFLGPVSIRTDGHGPAILANYAMACLNVRKSACNRAIKATAAKF